MDRRTFVKTALTSLATTPVLAGCKMTGIPVPADKAAYVGHWKGLGVDLIITPDGGVSWKRVSGSGSASVEAPLQSFDGNNFTVGVWFMTTTFTVQAPPYHKDGAWKMIVEGVELTKVVRGIRADLSAPPVRT